jgi:hypothetical protein
MLKLKTIFLAGVLALMPAAARAVVPAELSCDTIVRNGWDKMPDVADYIKTIPGSEKLGFGSECHLGSLVFAQCFVEPRWTVGKAVHELIRKARTGQRLPDTPACGA